MDTYHSEPATIAANINTIYNRLSKPELFQAQIEANRDRLPREAVENLDKIEFGPDSITIQSPMGPVKIAVDPNQSAAPQRLVFTAAQSPVAFNLAVNLTQISDTETESVAALEVDLPFFLKGMVGKHLAEGARQFGRMLAMLPYEEIQ